jgi:glutathione S-transferase
MSDERIVWGIGTSRTIRAHWALIELGLTYRTEPVRTRTPDTEAPEFVALNPRRKIPVLQDGPITLAESAAIVTHLAESYRDTGTVLIPDDRASRARYFEWLSRPASTCCGAIGRCPRSTARRRSPIRRRRPISPG